MLKKSLLTTLVLLVGYEILVRSTDFWWSTGQNTQQSSVVRAHNFMFAEDHFTNVMVGSSIGNRITSGVPTDSLPKGFYNLSFGGQSIFDGLLIIKNLDYSPDVVYIEVNTLLRNEDPNLQSSLFSPVLYPLKKALASLRERNQPIGVLARIPTISNGKPDKQKGSPPVYIERNDHTYKTMLEIEIRHKKDSISPASMADRISKLQSFVDYLKKKNVKIVFFEVPVDPAVCNLALPRQIRNAVKDAFLPQGCYFIDMPDCSGYLTTDATHLEKVSVYHYLNYFRSELKRQAIL